MTRSSSGLAALVGLLLFSPSWVWAEHTPEHRFTISGYVYDDAGKPLSGTVMVRDRGDNILETADTTISGYYRIRMRLHNSDLGDRLLIHSTAGKKELIVQFDPNDKTTERGAEVNFGAVPPSSWLRDNGVAVFLDALLLTAGTAYVASRRRKNQKRHQSKKKTPQGRETSR
jgi:hypothetical protein